MTHLELQVAAVLIGVYVLFLSIVFLGALVRAFIWRRRTGRSSALRPGIHEALVTSVSGSADLEPLQQYLRAGREDVADGILSFQGKISGGARDRLCELALQFGLVHEWCQATRSRSATERRAAYARLAFVSAYEPCRRVSGELVLHAIEDPDPDVRLSAARALLESGEPDEVELVFDLTLSRDLLTRILIAEDLRRHAFLLCEHGVPAALASNEYQRIRNTLEMLASWERSLPLQGLAALLDHPDALIRRNAVALAPFVDFNPAVRSGVICGLADQEADVRYAAAVAAGRMRLEDAFAHLARLVRVGPDRISRAAAHSLAAISRRGQTILEELSSNPDPAAARVARKALARAEAEGA